MSRTRLRLQGQRRQGGFTLTELMITVALIGTLASVAIPSFLSYQARTRRAESYNTLDGMATAYIAFYAESGFYPDMGFETTPTKVLLPDVPLANLGTTKSKWATAEPFFDQVGFQLEGDVWHLYDISAPYSDGSPNANCSGGCTNCFTITAHGDTDSDTALGAVMFVHPQRDAGGAVTGECQSAVFNYAAPVGAGGAAIYDEPAVNFGVDDY